MTDTEAAGKRETYSYSKMHFYIRSIIYSMLLISAALIFRGLTIEALPWFIFLVTLLFIILAVFGISPLFTSHWITRTRLILRQGWYFRSIIPMKDIESVDVYDGEPRMGLSLSTRSSILFVTSSRFDLLEIRLKKPRVYWQMLGLRARRIVVNVDERDRMLESLRTRLSLLAPVEANRPNA